MCGPFKLEWILIGCQFFIFPLYFHSYGFSIQFKVIFFYVIATDIVLGANGPECMMCCFYNKCCCSCLWDSLLLAVIEERPKQAAVQVIEDRDEKQLVEFKCRGKLQREQRKSLTGWHMLLHLKRVEATNGPSIWSAYSIKEPML